MTQFADYLKMMRDALDSGNDEIINFLLHYPYSKWYELEPEYHHKLLPYLTEEILNIRFSNGNPIVFDRLINKELLKLIIPLISDEQINYTYKFGTILHNIHHIDIIKMILDRITIETLCYLDCYKNTALFYACLTDNIDKVELLLPYYPIDVIRTVNKIKYTNKSISSLLKERLNNDNHQKVALKKK